LWQSPTRGVKPKFKNLAIFWGLAGNYCLNMALSFKIWGTLADLVMTHTWIFFLLPSGKNSPTFKKL
jgi:hypothetical protein